MAITALASSLPLLSCPSRPNQRSLCLHSTTPNAHSVGRTRAAHNEVLPILSRRSGNYPPTLWNDSYIQSLRNDIKEEHASRIKMLKERTRRLIEEEKEIVAQLKLVDALEQLGVAYHFEKEIMDVLTNIDKYMEDFNMVTEKDLYAAALGFRLLREHGFTPSQDIFASFKDEKGSFKSFLGNDARGLLSLYQASYLSMEGEEEMEEARDFATKHLNALKYRKSVEPCLIENINYALDLPLNWRVQRLHTRWFIESYEKADNINPMLLEFAKLDYNMVQNLYKGELVELSRWWTDLNLLGGNLSFVRDRLVENYFWAVAWAFEPMSRSCREAHTKFICFQTTIDDLYDVYGSPDELELFTDAVERWEISAIEQLPEYMKTCFLALLNTTNDIAYKILRDKSVDVIPYLKNAWADLCKAFLAEAKWYHNGYTPTFEEYMENASTSITGPLNLIVAYCVNEDVTIKALENIESYQDIIRGVSMIFRLCDDLGTSTDELERGDVPKSIQCYMHEKGVTELTARQQMKDLITIYWKRLNGKRFCSSQFEKHFKSVAFNIPRPAHVFYQYGDGYGKQPDRETKDQIITLFIEPISLGDSMLDLI